MKYNRIKQVLEDKRLTQQWLANQIGNSRESVNSLVNNRTQPSLVFTSRISKALEVPAFTLIGDYEGRPKKEEALKTLSEYLPQEVIDELACIIAEETTEQDSNEDE